MNSCDIDASGGEPIGNTLAHAMWRELRLNNNKLGSVGAANVVKGLAHNLSLISIELQVSVVLSPCLWRDNIMISSMRRDISLWLIN